MATATTSEKQIDSTVVAEARELRDEFLSQQAKYAQTAILHALSVQLQCTADEYPPGNNWQSFNASPCDARDDIKLRGIEINENGEQGNGEGDLMICGRKLWSITTPETPRKHPITFPLVPKLPHYTTWAPVYKNFLIKTPAETYFPFFGNDEDDALLSHKALTIMEKEEGKKSAFDMPSDGEVDQVTGFFVPRGFLDEMVRIDKLKDIRQRAAARHVAMQIIPKHGEGIKTLNSVREALKLADVKTVMAIFKLAERRFVESRKQEKVNNRMKFKTIALNDMLRHPTRAGKRPRASSLLNPLVHFCFICHEFSCDLHDEHRPIPNQPIPDECQRTRLSDIGFGSSRPCSQSCHATRAIDRCPLAAHEQEQWDDEEIELLCEALLLFENDPCTLSTIVGSRTCREIEKKLGADKTQKWMEDAFDSLKASGRMKDHQRIRQHVQFVIESSDGPYDDYSSSDDDNKILLARYKNLRRPRRSRGERKKKDKRGTARKSSIAVSDNCENWFSRACNHAGDCTQSCPCVMNGTFCESACACNGERFTFSERLDKIVTVGNACKNRLGFCRCSNGICNPQECPCSSTYEKTCDPQRCYCDCGIGPWHRALGKRTCRNMQVFAHKKTFVGRSQEAGFGLFAGEVFERGDLVGAYVGALLPAEIVDGRSAVGDLSNKMYTFDIRNATVDGTLLGAKVRFINHKEDWEAPNCQASEIRVHRHWYHRLTASRRVEPGEEFFFDYKIVDPGTRDDCAYSLPPWLEERRRPKSRGKNA